ncbi:MAG: hypothetical protein KGI00_02565 [Candidatus Micrarchaeota archaeon]|nr:hypothetical protein [Candidatus Micrarchaeota archaeon]MDE1849590.1 hypothetical protein [Candidatus Micrarchaeota archaeon]
MEKTGWETFVLDSGYYYPMLIMIFILLFVFLGILSFGVFVFGAFYSIHLKKKFRGNFKTYEESIGKKKIPVKKLQKKNEKEYEEYLKREGVKH